MNWKVPEATKDRSKSDLHKAVVVMFDPEATMRFYRWWKSYGFWDVHCQYRVSPESVRLEKMYPTLARTSSENFIEPMASLRTYITNPFLVHAKPEGRKAFINMSVNGPYFPLRGGAGPAADQSGTTLQGGFAYLLMDKDQGEVLSWFPRHLQPEIATWQVFLPSQEEQSPSDLSKVLAVGFFPESEYNRWRGYGFSKVSKGVSAGMGVFMSPPVVWATGGGVKIDHHDLFHDPIGNRFVLSTAR